MPQVKILFVCHGNTCRSPMAAALAQHLARAAGRTGLAFRSAGIAPRAAGGAADPRAVDCAARRGLDLTDHAVRAFDPLGDPASFDLVLALDDEVLASVTARTPADQRHKVKRLMSFAPDEAVGEVPDPYHGSAADYDYALGLIEKAINGLLRGGALHPSGVRAGRE